MSVRQKLTDIYIISMLFLFPLFPGFHGYARITAAKFYFLLIATVLWAALLIVLSIVERRSLGNEPTPALPELIALALAVTCTVSALVSPYFPDTILGTGRWDGLVTLLLYVMIFLGVRRFGCFREEHLYAAGASVLLQFAIAAAQLADLNPLGLFPGELRWSDAGIRYSGAFLGTIGNVDLLAAYLCLYVPLFAGAYIINPKRWPLLIPCFLGFLLLLYSGVSAGPFSLGLTALAALPFLLDRRTRISRFLSLLAAFLIAAAIFTSLRFDTGTIAFHMGPVTLLLLAAAVLSAAAACFLCLRSEKPDKSRRQYLFGVLCAEAVLVAACLAALWFYPCRTGTLFELHSVLHGQTSERFGSSRIRIWKETLALVPKRPLLGGGPGTLAIRLKIDFERYVPETGQTLRSFVDNAHNVYLGYLADTGSLGLAAYLALIVSSAVEILRRRSEPLRLVLGFALLCGWIADLFGLGLCLTAPMLWLIWGLSLSTGRRDVPEGS